MAKAEAKVEEKVQEKLAKAEVKAKLKAVKEQVAKAAPKAPPKAAKPTEAQQAAYGKRLVEKVPEGYIPLNELRTKAAEMGITWGRLDRALGGDRGLKPQEGWDGLVYVWTLGCKRFVPAGYVEKLPALLPQPEAKPETVKAPPVAAKAKAAPAKAKAV